MGFWLQVRQIVREESLRVGFLPQGVPLYNAYTACLLACLFLCLYLCLFVFFFVCFFVSVSSFFYLFPPVFSIPVTWILSLFVCCIFVTPVFLMCDNIYFH